MRIWARSRHRLRSDLGASAVEYGLMVAAITAVIVVAVFALGGALNASFTKSEQCLSNVTGTPSNLDRCPPNP